MPATAAPSGRICPECGSDPRAGRVRAPWWGRRTGLPLWLALLALAALATVVLRKHEWSSNSAAGRSSVSYPGRLLAGITVGDLHTAAAGNDEAAARLVRLVTDAARTDTHPLARPVVYAVTDEREWFSERRIGWPVGWLIMLKGGDSTAAPWRRVPPPQGWTFRPFNIWGRWDNPDGAFLDLQINLDALVLIAAVTVALYALLLVLLKRWHVRRTRLICGFAAALVCAAAAAASHVELDHGDQSRLPNRVVPLVWDQVHRLADTAPGRQEIARGLAACVISAESTALVHVHWQFNTVDYNGGWVGWPTGWVYYSSLAPVRPTADPVEQPGRHLGWRHNSLVWVSTDASGKQQTVSLMLPGIAMTALLVLAFSALPAGTWWLLRGRRLRRWQREGRCFTCGYEVGVLPPSPPA